MCGIGGYVCLGEQKPDPDEVFKLWVELTVRGRDACGAAWKEADGKITIVKNALTPDKLLEHVKPVVGEQTMPDMMILHTRAATKGPIKDNKNNHPIYDEKTGLVLVHNGMITNDNEVLAGARRDGLVDSEALLSVMSRFGSTWEEKVRAVGENVEGSFAVLALSRHLDGMLAFKHYNPLDWGVDLETEIAWFASDERYIKKALGDKMWKGFPLGRKLETASIPNDTALVVTREGLKEVFKFAVKERAVQRFLHPVSHPNYHRAYIGNEDDMGYYDEAMAFPSSPEIKKENLSDPGEIFPCPFCNQAVCAREIANARGFCPLCKVRINEEGSLEVSDGYTE